VWIYNPSTYVKRQLTSSSTHEFSGVFSPNGQQLAYIRSGTELRRVNLDGTVDVLLLSVSGGGIESPRWSPDGKIIYYERGSQLYAVSSALGGSEIARSSVASNLGCF